MLAAFNLRGPTEDHALAQSVREAFGTEPPGAPNSFTAGPNATIAWLGPDEWLILGREEQDSASVTRASGSLSDHGFSVTDVAGDNAIFQLRGPAARDLIAAGCPLDTHPRNFGVGRCSQSPFARTRVILLHRDDTPTYEILVRRSFARYLWAWLESTAGLSATS